MASSGNGFNPMRWDCEKQGCFNLKRRPKIEVFADCFPRRINFGDVDGLVELNSKALLLEWKSIKGTLPKGQEIAFKNLTTEGNITTLCVVGDAETMECTHYGFFWQGKWHKYRPTSLEDVKEFLKRWVKKVSP
jgi:hypothetical protein